MTQNCWPKQLKKKVVPIYSDGMTMVAAGQELEVLFGQYIFNITFFDI